MSRKLTRRGFMVASATALASAAAGELTGGLAALEMTGFEALASKSPQEETMPHVIV